MSTWTAIYVKANIESVVTMSKSLLADPIRATVVESVSDCPNVKFSLYSKFPHEIAIASGSTMWTIVMMDGFYFPNKFAPALSSKLHTVAVDTVAQTTSDVYQIAVYQNGKIIRQLEHSEGDWIANEGTPLKGEPKPLDSKEVEDDDTHGNEDFSFFGVDDMRGYCSGVFGFRFWDDPTLAKE